MNRVLHKSKKPPKLSVTLSPFETPAGKPQPKPPRDIGVSDSKANVKVKSKKELLLPTPHFDDKEKDRKSPDTIKPPSSYETSGKLRSQRDSGASSGSKASVKGVIPQIKKRSPWDEALELKKIQIANNKPLLATPKFDDDEKKETIGLFTPAEIKRLGIRFRKLDKDHSGSLSLEEFMYIPELSNNPLVQRVIDIFDVDRNGEVDFKEFMQGMSHFTVSGNKGMRLRFAFRIFDMDNDGYISNGELFQVMKMILGKRIVDTDLQHLVNTTIMLGDENGDGKISYQEFVDLVTAGTAGRTHHVMVLEGV